MTEAFAVIRRCRPTAPVTTILMWSVGFITSRRRRRDQLRTNCLGPAHEKACAVRTL